MNFLLATLSVTALLTGCATKYQGPSETEPSAKVRFVANEDMLIGSGYKSPAGCTPRPDRQVSSHMEQISMFGPKAFFGLPFSPGDSLQMPDPPQKRQFFTEKKFRAGEPVTLGFYMTLREWGGGGTRTMENCSAALTFVPQMGDDYQLRFAVAGDRCRVVLQRYDPVARVWTLPADFNRVTQAPLCP